MSVENHGAPLDIETAVINGTIDFDDRDIAAVASLRAAQGQALRATLVACTKEIVSAIHYLAEGR